MKYDTEFSSYFVVDIVNEDDSICEQLLWGVVVLDLKGRFDKGRRVITSSIQKIIDNDDEQYVFTRNSIYKITKSQGDTIDLPSNLLTYFLLSRGFSPIYIREQFVNNDSDISTAIH